MSEYYATVRWKRDASEDFSNSKYSREHRWEFDGGAVVMASPSPHIVPAPHSVAAHVDPEEAFVAALSSCHMLFFLSLVAKRRWTVDQYADNAVGLMSKDSRGLLAMTEVTLCPAVRFSGERMPTRDDVAHIHHQAHEHCFIANSVKTVVAVKPVFSERTSP